MGSPARPRVLIADDYAPMATALARLLTPDCDVVGVVADGEGAVAAARRLDPDVMLIDLNLPDMSGVDVCRAITRANPRAKVILITGLVDPTLEQLARAAGAAAFLSKVAAGDELLGAIRSAVARLPDQ